MMNAEENGLFPAATGKRPEAITNDLDSTMGTAQAKTSGRSPKKAKAASGFVRPEPKFRVSRTGGSKQSRSTGHYSLEDAIVAARSALHAGRQAQILEIREGWFEVEGWRKQLP